MPKNRWFQPLRLKISCVFFSLEVIGATIQKQMQFFFWISFFFQCSFFRFWILCVGSAAVCPSLISLHRSWGKSDPSVGYWRPFSKCLRGLGAVLLFKCSPDLLQTFWTVCASPRSCRTPRGNSTWVKNKNVCELNMEGVIAVCSIFCTVGLALKWFILQSLQDRRVLKDFDVLDKIPFKYFIDWV